MKEQILEISSGQVSAFSANAKQRLELKNFLEPLEKLESVMGSPEKRIIYLPIACA